MRGFGAKRKVDGKHVRLHTALVPREELVRLVGRVGHCCSACEPPTPLELGAGW